MNGYGGTELVHIRKEELNMAETITRTVKSGKNIGIAEQVQGKTVDVKPHPRFKGMWLFEFKGETWIASDYAFIDW